ncbi:hypothetical protein GTR00_04695 [Kineococcus sp. T90]|nr:hypothetical protein [Kineococcus indalonis]
MNTGTSLSTGAGSTTPTGSTRDVVIGAGPVGEDVADRVAQAGLSAAVHADGHRARARTVVDEQRRAVAGFALAGPDPPIQPARDGPRSCRARPSAERKRRPAPRGTS